MSQTFEKNVDINEAFENLLLAEELAEQSGFQEGFNVGKNRTLNGYHLGYHRASLLAAQVGYYSGVVEYCLQQNTFSPRIRQEAAKIQEHLKTLPLTNSEDVDILQKIDDIKFKITKLCSLAKIDGSYPEADKLDF